MRWTMFIAPIPTSSALSPHRVGRQLLWLTTRALRRSTDSPPILVFPLQIAAPDPSSPWYRPREGLWFGPRACRAVPRSDGQEWRRSKLLSRAAYATPESYTAA